ncbi:hypothetical protein [Geomesophilobacter sediminis]|uniref:Uncharacterized protein n=1 Tax=Geomesophilobacter sediminis TaxID=2798584 RepID=A0A8J7JH18_9BACT|nr:hypothetical protein [Geomesophilobacter sediminis]MBJ6726354.1 hypothetical protein [Geomesophilobacter sediminis]
MLYILGDTSKTWEAVARILAAREKVDMVALYYPGTEIPPSPFLVAARFEDLEPVTTWDEDASATASARMHVNSQFLGSLAALSFDSFEGDLALYPPRTREWIACAIPHEKMVLVRDDQLLGPLREVGVPALDTAPDGWW